MKRWQRLGALSLFAAVMACGGDDGFATEEVTVDVADRVGGQPLVGATVVVEVPDGARYVGTTDAAGRAVVVDVPVLDQGTIDVTAIAADHVLGTRIEIPRTRYAAGPVALALQPEPRPQVHVTGVVTGHPDPAHMLYVNTDTGLSWQGSLARLPHLTGAPPMIPRMVSVPAGAPFRLRAWEFSYAWAGRDLTQVLHRIAEVDVPALTADGVVTVNLTAGVMPHTASPTVLMPPLGHVMRGGTAYAVVRERGTNGVLGVPTRVALAGDESSVDLDLAWLSPGRGHALTTRYSVGGAGRDSYVDVDGAPADGMLVLAWLMPPAVMTPPPGTSAHFGDDVGVFADLAADTVLIEIADTRLRWQVWAPDGTIRLPTPPDEVDVSGWASTLTAQVSISAPRMGPRQAFATGGAEATFTIAR